MRLAPVALFALHDANQAEHLARDQSRITHAAPQAVEACALFVQILREAILLCEPDVLRPRNRTGLAAAVVLQDFDHERRAVGQDDARLRQAEEARLARGVDEGSGGIDRHNTERVEVITSVQRRRD